MPIEKHMPRYVKEFEECYFWKNVMLPAMQAAIVEGMERMIYVEDVRSIRSLQTMVRTLQIWSAFPKRKHAEAVDDIEFEQDKTAAVEEKKDKPE